MELGICVAALAGVAFMLGQSYNRGSNVEAGARMLNMMLRDLLRQLPPDARPEFLAAVKRLGYNALEELNQTKGQR